mmetsp:Transcript_7348/g.6508  ORF Transcript_7348/g.6508 Transcript_7348/m.6508 type:complete len:164 (+) Transcript_7348:463-954(+)
MNHVFYEGKKKDENRGNNTNYTSFNHSLTKSRKGRSRMQTMNKPSTLAIRMMQARQNSNIIPNSSRNEVEQDLTMIDTQNYKQGDSINERISNLYENSGFINEEQKRRSDGGNIKFNPLTTKSPSLFPPLHKKPKEGESSFQNASVNKTSMKLNQEIIEENGE